MSQSAQRYSGHGDVFDTVVDISEISRQYDCNYTVWYSMLQRCHNSKIHKQKPTYSGCAISDNFKSLTYFLDWAKQQGWEYFTLDKCWEQNGVSLKEVVDYASSKSVGVFVWVNQNSLPSDESAMVSMVQNWKAQGVKGLKVDFWESDDQAMMKKY